MSEDWMVPDLERRIARSLQGSAPVAPPDLGDRILRRTAAQPQRRPWRLRMAPALVAASTVVVLAVTVGLGIGRLLPFDGVPGVGGSPTATPSIAVSPEASASDAPSPSPAASSSPSFSAGALPDGIECVNDELGFGVRYPPDWWANEAVVPDDPALTPIEGCRYFAGEPVVLQPNAGIPATVAIVAGLAADPIGPNAEPIEVLSQRTVEVAGTTATLEEVEWTEDTAFVPAGTRRYSYTIPRPDGDALTFTTTSMTGDYAEHRRVLDAMMRTLELGAG